MRILAILSIVAALAAPAQVSARPYDLKIQVARLMDWWPGRYDNHEQIVRQSGGGLSDTVETPYQRRHTVVRAVTRADLGPNVLYVADYEHGDETRPVRARLLAVSADEKADGVRVRRYDLPKGVSLPADPSVPGDLPALAAAAATPLGDDCDFLLHHVGEQFEGGVASARCKADPNAREYRLVVGRTLQWVREPLVTGQDHGWFEQTRAKMFVCSVHEDAAGVMRDTKHLTDVRLHDQGGAADIPWPDGRTLTFRIQSRAFTSPADYVSPLFGVHEKGKTVPIAYAYTSQEANRFGLNLGWFYIRCYAEGSESAMERFTSQPAAPAPPR